MEVENNRMNQKLTLQTLNDDVLMEVFKFLTLKDIAIIQTVSKEWKKCTEKPFLWRSIKYDFQENQISNKEQYIAWFIEKLEKYKVEQLTLNDNYKYLTLKDVATIFSIRHYQLRDLELSLFFDFQSEQQQESFSSMLCQMISKFCPNMQSFTTYGSFLSDKNMIAFSSLSQLKSFSIKCNDNCFTGSGLKYLPPLEKVIIHLYQLQLFYNSIYSKHEKPYLVEFDNIIETVRKAKDTLVDLAIDTEQLEEWQMIQLLGELNKNKIESLLLNYCEYFTDQVFCHLSEFKNLKRLKYYKANEVTSEGYYKWFSRFQTSSLIHLNIKECNELNDEGLIAILQKSKQLECLKLSWQKYISSESINYLFQNCPNILSCTLVGLKSLDGKGFPEICDLQPFFKSVEYSNLKRHNQYTDDFNNDCINNEGYTQIALQDYFTKPVNRDSVKLYQRLKFLDCTKSDMVPDEILQILHLFRPYLTAHNYYGENM